MSWTDERVEKLKTLWAEGLSASQICYRLSFLGGSGVTRNAVIGKIHRLGLSGRAIQNRFRPATPKPKKDRRKVVINRGGAGFMRNKPILPPQTPEQLSLYKQRILALPPTVHGIEAFDPSCQCGYVHGEPSEQARCGRPKVDGLRYCREHADLCSQGITVAQKPAIWVHGTLGGRVKGDVQQLREVEEFTAA